MTLGEFKELTKHMPEDTLIIFWAHIVEVWDSMGEKVVDTDIQAIDFNVIIESNVIHITTNEETNVDLIPSNFDKLN